MYSRDVKQPKTDKEGLSNFIQMIINEIEAGNTREALLKAVDLQDGIQCCKFSWIDPDRKPEFENEPAEEPAQITTLVPANLENKRISDHRNSYYI